MCTRSFAQLNDTFFEYSKYANQDIEEAIKSEMTGNTERACLAIGNLIIFKNVTKYFFFNILKQLQWPQQKVK